MEPEQNDVFVFQVITPYVPLEIVGTVNGYQFYYRGRHNRWGVYRGLWEYAEGKLPMASGHTERVGEECELTFAFVKILTAFTEKLKPRDVIV